MTAGVVVSADGRIALDEYLDLLARSDLGRLYPPLERESRIARVLIEADVVVAARSDDLLVGACLALTDFAYFAFLTDLGVARDWTRRGIGRKLVELAVERAGGADRIHVVTWSNAESMGFYAACGLTPRPRLVAREAER